MKITVKELRALVLREAIPGFKIGDVLNAKRAGSLQTPGAQEGGSLWEDREDLMMDLDTLNKMGPVIEQMKEILDTRDFSAEEVLRLQRILGVMAGSIGSLDKMLRRGVE